MTRTRNFFKETDCDTVHYYLYQPLVTKIAPVLKKINVHPNQVTTFRLVLSICFLIFMITKKDFILKNKKLSITLIIFIYYIYGVTDDLDGYMARRYNLKSNFGDKFDKIVDQLVAISSIVLYIYYNLNNLKYIIVIAITMITTYIIKWKNKSCSLIYFNLDHPTIQSFLLCICVLIN